MGSVVTGHPGVHAGLALWCALSVAACSAAPATRAAAASDAQSGTSAAGSPAPAARAGARLVCHALGPREQTRALSAQARAELEASRDGEHYLSARFEPAMTRLREAALGGERLAQSVYGKTRFATLFSYDAPRPEQRELYVEALAFWRTSALASPEADPSGITDATPEGLELPLAELPADWLREAWARADTWIRCHGLPW